MKAIMALALLLVAGYSIADTYVNGYVKRDGTYVQPHMRSDANSYKFDNYSSQGNSNPYTGQRGYERNEYSNPTSYNQPQQFNPPPVYQYQNPYGN